jgi:hypothetical protein
MADMEPKTKFVDFNQYCPKCKYKDVTPTADPCNNCLTVPAREGTRKPEKFEEAKKEN